MIVSCKGVPAASGVYVSQMCQEEMSQIHDFIEDPDFLKSYEGEPLYTMPISLRIGEHNLQGYGIV